MARFLRFIGFLVLALALWQVAGEAFTDKIVNGGNAANVTRPPVTMKSLAANSTSPSVTVTSLVATAKDFAVTGKGMAEQGRQSASSITAPQLPYLPDAELADIGERMRLPGYCRIQRSSTTEYVFSLREWVGRLALRAAVLSLHREKLYDVTAYHPCQPVCEYYIFALRRILI